MLGDRALLVLACYHHRQVAEMRPYFEALVSVPVWLDSRWTPPILPVLMGSRWKRFGQHVLAMPVTSSENQIRGVEIWRLPKTLEQVSMTVEGDGCRSTVMQGGELSFEFSVPTKGPSKHIDDVARLFSVRGKEVWVADNRYFGRYQCHRFRRRKAGKSTPFLRLGEGPQARMLAGLDIDPIPMETRFCDCAQSALMLPEPLPARMPARQTRELQEVRHS